MFCRPPSRRHAPKGARPQLRLSSITKLFFTYLISDVFKRTFSLEVGALGGRLFLVCGRDAPGHVISAEHYHMLQIYCFTGPICHSSRVQYLTQYSMAVSMASLEPTTNHTLQNTLYTITCCCIKLQLRTENRRAGEGGGGGG